MRRLQKEQRHHLTQCLASKLLPSAVSLFQLLRPSNTTDRSFINNPKQRCLAGKALCWAHRWVSHRNKNPERDEGGKNNHKCSCLQNAESLWREVLSALKAAVAQSRAQCWVQIWRQKSQPHAKGKPDRAARVNRSKKPTGEQDKEGAEGRKMY